MIKRNILYLSILSFFSFSNALPPSLKNCGNSCYINATTQALLSIDPLKDFLKAAPPPFYPRNNNFGNAFQELIKKSNPNPPDAILNKYIQKSRALMGRSTAGTRQGDASEFVELALNNLLGNENFASLLYITMGSTPFCFIDNTEVEMGTNIQTERTLKLPIQAPKNAIITSLNEGLAQYIESESIDYIQGAECKRRIHIADIGPYFAIALNRFRYDTSGAHKIDNIITIPFDLDMTPYILNSPKSYKYRLHATVIHSGSAEGGHYYAYIKQEPVWYLCNDSQITVTTAETVQAEANKGYFFIYKQIEGPDESIPFQEPSLLETQLQFLQLELQELQQALQMK